MRAHLGKLGIFSVLVLAFVACGDEGNVGGSGDNDAGSSDQTTFSFVFVGCNRVGWKAKDGLALPESTANEPQLLQTFSDVASKFTPTPAYLFLCGDIVRNEQPGTKTLSEQLALWQGVWKVGALAGSSATQVVPFTGNHEVLVSVQYGDEKFYEVPNASAYADFSEWLSDTGHYPTAAQANGPKDAAGDLLVGDHSQLTFSFDAPLPGGKKVHFVVACTDSHSSYKSDDASCYQPPQKDVTFNGKTIQGTMSQAVPGWVPLTWLKKDIDAAVADPSVDLIFVLGHKPIFNQDTTTGTPSTGRDTIFNCGSDLLADGLFATFQSAQEAGKFGGYLCAHQHLWGAMQIDGGKGPGIWQIVAGNGGTKLQAGDQFGFTYVQVHSSGRVTATGYGRPVPSPYYGPDNTPAEPVGEPITLRGPRE